jgi:reversibly glycosylated polypeptide / UDP-arabinopyranose mutase
MKIAVIVPTTEDRQAIYAKFCDAWYPLIAKHNAELVTVRDGDKPTANGLSVKEVMGTYKDVIFNKSDVVRNLGFAYAKKYYDPDVYITLDDDVLPLDGKDAIQEHLDALQMEVSINWLNTADYPMRGLPYNTRTEAEVVLSHGVWLNVPDLDAPNQLVNPNVKPNFYKGVIPKGTLYPMCIMNVAFKKEILPYMYQVPMNTHGMDRFGDIWSGILAKRDIDRLGYAVVTGYSTIWHDRASNVFKNLQKEAKGIEINETFWRGDEQNEYFTMMHDKRSRWMQYVSSC